MILEKLTDVEDSFIFLDCNVRNFFAISLFSMIVIRSAMKDLELGGYFEYLQTCCLQTSQ